MPRKLSWYHDNDECTYLGEFADDTAADEAPQCPYCGQTTDYVEGQIDQDTMGNDIYGYWFVCWLCHISTEVFEG
jgi:hypothetical protein